MKAVSRRGVLDALGRRLARALHAAAAALEKDERPGPDDPDPLAATLARLRERYPDAPEHWLRFVAERMPANAAATEAAESAEPDQRGEHEASASGPSIGRRSGSNTAVESTVFDRAAALGEPRRDAARGERLGVRPVSRDVAPVGVTVPPAALPTTSGSTRAFRATRPAIGFAAQACEPMRAVDRDRDPGFPRPRFHRHAPPRATDASAMPQAARRPMGAFRFDPVANRRAEPPAAIRPTARPTPERSSSAAFYAIGASAPRSRIDVAVSPEPSSLDAPSPPKTQSARSEVRHVAPDVDVAPPAVSWIAPRLVPTPRDRRHRNAPRDGSVYHSLSPFGGMTVPGPIFAAEEPPWPELPEPLEPRETNVDVAAGRFPREEPERWNALPF